MHTFYPHTKLYITISVAKLYPITPKQDYIIFSRFKSSHCYRIEIFKFCPIILIVHLYLWSPCNTRPYYLVSNFRPNTHLWILKSIPYYLHATLPYYTDSNLHYIIRLQIFKYIAYYPQGKNLTYFPMKHNTKNILIQILIPFPACRYCNAYLFIPIQNYTLISPLQNYTLLPPSKTISYFPDSNLHIVTALRYSNLCPIILLAKLYPMLPMQYSTLPSCFQSSP